MLFIFIIEPTDKKNHLTEIEKSVENNQNRQNWNSVVLSGRKSSKK
jgi:hypothetical protein